MQGMSGNFDAGHVREKCPPNLHSYSFSFASMDGICMFSDVAHMMPSRQRLRKGPMLSASRKPVPDFTKGCGKSANYKKLQTKNLRVNKEYGKFKFSISLRNPTFKNENLIESSPQKSRFLVSRIGRWFITPLLLTLQSKTWYHVNMNNRGHLFQR